MLTLAQNSISKFVAGGWCTSNKTHNVQAFSFLKGPQNTTQKIENLAPNTSLMKLSLIFCWEEKWIQIIIQMQFSHNFIFRFHQYFIIKEKTPQMGREEIHFILFMINLTHFPNTIHPTLMPLQTLYLSQILKWIHLQSVG